MSLVSVLIVSWPMMCVSAKIDDGAGEPPPLPGGWTWTWTWLELREKIRAGSAADDRSECFAWSTDHGIAIGCLAKFLRARFVQVRFILKIVVRTAIVIIYK